MKPLRPTYQRKHDRLIHGGTPREDLAIDLAIAPFDRRAREADTKWGTDRLPELVSPETAARYGRTLGSLNEAIDAKDLDRVIDRAAACIRGMNAMDEEAVNAGHVPPDTSVVEQEVDGFTFGLLLDDRMWQRAVAQHPDLAIYTLRDVGVLLKLAHDGHPLLEPFKQAFPGAKLIDVRKAQTLGKVLDDQIPF